MRKNYQICLRCVMDTSAPDIEFDSHGICNYCTEFLEQCGPVLNEDIADKNRKLASLISSIKNDGKGKPYDCVVGVSGGVDSSWVLVKVVEYGLRPLTVHMDNGWNSELAQNNIENLVNGMGLDLFTHVIDWEEYRSLMQAFFSADVVDIELLYDNAMLAVNYSQAQKYGLKYILSGSNKSSEGIRIPRSWAWHKFDFRNIKSIGRMFGEVKISSFPGIGTFGRAWHEVICNRRWISFLDYLNYDKFKAMDELSKTFKYKPYPYKHYESIFTRLYQGYILPNKFGIDKRRMHFSTLIMSGQMSRELALNDLSNIPYSSLESLNEDINYFLKKMKWDISDLQDYLSRTRIEHDAYPSERYLYERLVNSYRRISK